MQIKLIFTFSLILKVRVFGTPKWPVVLLRSELLIQQISIRKTNWANPSYRFSQWIVLFTFWTARAWVERQLRQTGWRKVSCLRKRCKDKAWIPEGIGTSYNGPYREALPERGIFFRLQVYETGTPGDNFWKISVREAIWDLRFVVKFLACLPLLGFSNLPKIV